MKCMIKNKIKFVFIVILFLTFFGCNNITESTDLTSNTDDFTTQTTTESLTTTEGITTTSETTVSSETTEVILVSIEIDESTLQGVYDLNDFEIGDIDLLLNWSDSSSSTVPISLNMLSTGDIDLLHKLGLIQSLFPIKVIQLN